MVRGIAATHHRYAGSGSRRQLSPDAGAPEQRAAGTFAASWQGSQNLSSRPLILLVFPM